MKKIVIAATLVVAIICSITSYCYCKSPDSEYDDEAVFTDDCQDEIEVPDDILWEEKVINDTDEKGRKVIYTLKDKKVTISVDGKEIYRSDDGYFVQDIIVADIDKDEEKDPHRVDEKSEKEIIMLIWKIGRFGPSRPFWINDDEIDYSQHIFTYNIDGDKLAQKWVSSYMGAEAKSIAFSDGLLFFEYANGREVPWKWEGFGFKRVDDVDFVVAGDNLLHVEIYRDALDNYGGNFEYIYKKAKAYNDDADFSIINLETPLVEDPARYSTYPCFGSPIQVAQALKKSGFDCVTLSNNHRFDKGASGVDETLKALDNNDLLHVGSMDDKPYLIVVRNEIVFALLNYTYGTNGIRPPKGYENGVNMLEDEEKIREDIRKAKEEADFVIVFPHWGAEYITQPNSHEIYWRDIFYEEGVDAVIGTHPHVIQPYEMYKAEDSDREMLVYYSLGNYISSNQRPEHNSGGLALFSVRKTTKGVEVVSYSFATIDTMFRASKYR